MSCAALAIGFAVADELLDCVVEVGDIVELPADLVEAHHRGMRF